MSGIEMSFCKLFLCFEHTYPHICEFDPKVSIDFNSDYQIKASYDFKNHAEFYERKLPLVLLVFFKYVYIIEKVWVL